MWNWAQLVGLILAWNGKGGISYLIWSFSVGKQARIFTSYVRSLGVPCRQYIDDKHVGQLASRPQSNKTVTRWSDFEYADAATFMCTSVLVSICYFIGLSKSCLVPQQLITFLGFFVDSITTCLTTVFLLLIVCMSGLNWRCMCLGGRKEFLQDPFGKKCLLTTQTSFPTFWCLLKFAWFFQFRQHVVSVAILAWLVLWRTGEHP